MFIDIPKHRQDLWKKFHPDNYPVWSYRRGEGEESVYSLFTQDVVLTLLLATTRVADSPSPKKGDSSSAFGAVK
jgi:hypothetical protein